MNMAQELVALCARHVIARVCMSVLRSVTLHFQIVFVLQQPYELFLGIPEDCSLTSNTVATLPAYYRWVNG